MAYFAIPFSLGTIMGLAGIALQSNVAFPTFPRLMTSVELNDGVRSSPYSLFAAADNDLAARDPLRRADSSWKGRCGSRTRHRLHGGYFYDVFAADRCQLDYVRSLPAFRRASPSNFRSAFDVYKTWLRPKATDAEVIRVSHYAVMGFGIFMSAFSTALYYGGVSLGWTI